VPLALEAFGAVAFLTAALIAATMVLAAMPEARSGDSALIGAAWRLGASLPGAAFMWYALRRRRALRAALAGAFPANGSYGLGPLTFGCLAPLAVGVSLICFVTAVGSREPFFAVPPPSVRDDTRERIRIAGEGLWLTALLKEPPRFPDSPDASDWKNNVAYSSEAARYDASVWRSKESKTPFAINTALAGKRLRDLTPVVAARTPLLWSEPLGDNNERETFFVDGTQRRVSPREWNKIKPR